MANANQVHCLESILSSFQRGWDEIQADKQETSRKNWVWMAAYNIKLFCEYPPRLASSFVIEIAFKLGISCVQQLLRDCDCPIRNNSEDSDNG